MPIGTAPEGRDSRLGRRAEVLVDAVWGIRRHEAALAVGRLAPGVYVIGFPAGGVVSARRLTVAY